MNNSVAILLIRPCFSPRKLDKIFYLDHEDQSTFQGVHDLNDSFEDNCYAFGQQFVTANAAAVVVAYACDDEFVAEILIDDTYYFALCEMD